MSKNKSFILSIVAAVFLAVGSGFSAGAGKSMQQLAEEKLGKGVTADPRGRFLVGRGIVIKLTKTEEGILATNKTMQFLSSLDGQVTEIEDTFGAVDFFRLLRSLWGDAWARAFRYLRAQS